MSADRERTALENERVELQKQQAALEAERGGVNDSVQQTVSAFNARAGALDQRVQAWNERSAGHSQRAKAVNEERETWMTECADRRYREDDEIAIRKGQ